MNILVTGASGFVGKELVAELIKRNIAFSVYNRDKDEPKSFRDFTTIIHLAAKVHDMNYPGIDSFIPGNVELTEKLVKRAITDQVQHFIFLSSIKVNGEEQNQAYFEVTVPAPTDPYGLSKWMAENSIKEQCANSHAKVQYTIIRPPLIFGKGVKGNFLTLKKLANLPIPLPLGGIQNKRSFIALKNLVDLLIYCAEHTDESFNQTFLAHDGNDYSTSELLKLLSENKSTFKLFHFSKNIFKLALILIGKKNYYSKIFESLTIDSTQMKKKLQWKPKSSFQENM